MPTTLHATTGRDIDAEEVAFRKQAILDDIYDGKLLWGFIVPDHCAQYSLIPTAGGRLRMVPGRVRGAVAVVAAHPLADDEEMVEEAVEHLRAMAVILPPKRSKGCSTGKLRLEIGRALRRWHEAGHRGVPPAEWVNATGHTQAEVEQALTSLQNEYRKLLDRR